MIKKIIFSSILFVTLISSATAQKKLLGMYMHQHWAYKHPYAVRTWSLDEWHGYLDGLHRLGYNAILIWPMLETMPEPLTPSDEENIAKIARVIDMAHDDYKMNVSIVLCPNVSAKNEEASKYTFQDRPFFHTDDRVDPGDPVAFGKLMAWREKIFTPLSKTDGLYIIDSDPGGYPNSTNMEFVYILGAHRRMLDHLRKGIQLDYWALAGWEAYSKYYATGELTFGPESELQDAIALIAKQHYEPWGVASHRGPHLLDSMKMSERVISYPYAVIESEPSFPFTIFGGDRATAGAKKGAPRGIMGNAQTHCVQLPNTFAFARSAQGLSTDKKDYIQFANDLIPRQGTLIVECWDALQGGDIKLINAAAKKLIALKPSQIKTGPLKGLLFGDAARFVDDLVLQLKMASAAFEFKNTIDRSPQQTAKVKSTLAALATAAANWQQKHGYGNRWVWKPMDDALRKLGSAEINAIIDSRVRSVKPGEDPFQQVKDFFMMSETYTPRLIKAMKDHAAQLNEGAKK